MHIAGSGSVIITDAEISKLPNKNKILKIAPKCDIIDTICNATHKRQAEAEELARVSDGFNGADITEFCEKLKMEAIKETLSSGEEHKITMKDVEKIKCKIQSSVSDEDVAELFEFEKNN